MSSMNFHFVAYKLKNEGSCLVISIDIFLQMILNNVFILKHLFGIMPGMLMSFCLKECINWLLLPQL